MVDEIDHNPVQREAKLRAACVMLRRSGDEPDLRRACAVILALSCDPMSRMIAGQILQLLDTQGSHHLDLTR